VGNISGHEDRVACVKWISRRVHRCTRPGAAFLASGGSDGSVRVWAVQLSERGVTWRLAACLRGDAASTDPGNSTSPAARVSSIACHALPGERPHAFALALSSAVDCVTLWRCAAGHDAAPASSEAASCCDAARWSVLQRVAVPGIMQLCCAITEVPGTGGWCAPEETWGTGLRLKSAG